jgi:hypothetical protein
VILFSATLSARFQLQFAYVVFESRCEIVWADWKDTGRKKESGGATKRAPGVFDALFLLRYLAQRVNLSVEKCRTILKIDLYLRLFRMTSVPELSADEPT